MDYILGIDMGSQSIGWAICPCDNEFNVSGLHDLGVRIFDDGRDSVKHQPLGVGRREAKQTARRRQRAFNRRQALLKCLRKHDLLPDDPKASAKLARLDPYEFRAKGVNQRLKRHEIGRALLHINKRRGFKSNRKDASSDDKELTGMKKGIESLRDELGDESTLGQYLYRRKNSDPKATLRFRPTTDASSNQWDIYPERSMFEAEIRTIFDEQSKHYPDLDEQLVKKLLHIIIEQRPLKKPKIGSCRFFVEDDRAPLALPSQQRFRIYQEVANLEIQDGAEHRALNERGRNDLVDQLLLRASQSHLRKNGELSFSKLKTKIIGVSSVGLNLEQMGRSGLKADITTRVLSSKDCFGKRWFDLSLAEQDEIVLKLSGSEDKPLQDDDGTVKAWLVSKWRLSGNQADACLCARLEDGYGRLGKRALSLLLPHLESGLNYSQAVEASGLKDPLRHIHERSHLPYYGEILENYTMPHPAHGRAGMKDVEEVRFGRIPNPTVHIGLNQLRRVVNALIDRYGKPRLVRVELAREFYFSERDYSEAKTRQMKNRKFNDEAREEIAKSGGDPKSRDDLLKFKLWLELNTDPLKRCCPFSGRPISRAQLFSSEVEIEHLLPFSRTFDDSFNNKTLCYRDKNRLKLNQTPYEAFGESDEYSEIVERVKAFKNPAKEWRFREDAEERFLRKNPDLIARTLNDTRYLSRATVAYLKTICPKVETVRGAMTASLRHFWGLDRALSDTNAKDRSEHRHHAIDAFVVASCTAGFLRRFQALTEYAKREHPGRNPLHLSDFPTPYPDYKPSQIAEKALKIIVSHRQSHIQTSGLPKSRDFTPGQLHEETFFGLDAESGKQLIL
ncbi:MAG TPA: type II CRISPR RNA-guided endonuclease Cas9, partial [Opitutales bacterium]|nr:type II CRISPR RNA-guided endonuclease Cas9 [Opitutales bacterium]